MTIKTQLHKNILTHLQSQQNTTPTEQEIQSLCKNFIQENNIFLPQEELLKLENNTTFRILGLGPIEPLLQNNEITEIMINGPSSIFIEKKGNLEKSKITFENEAQLISIINRIVGKIGRRIDESTPFVDARLPDGSRINAIIPPLSLNGAILTIRKFPQKPFTIKDLLKNKSITQEMADFLEESIVTKQNIIISGGTGSGKTSTLNACASMIPNKERIITIEDSAEIRINHQHLISLESKTPNIEGKGEVTIRTLLKNALRMRPDRIVVGEIRSQEAIDMLQAMNTGHKGSLTTVHANSPLESLFRIETMILMGSTNIPLQAIRPQIAQAIDLIIQQSRDTNGKRKITKITKLEKTLKTETYQTKDLFTNKANHQVNSSPAKRGRVGGGNNHKSLSQ